MNFRRWRSVVAALGAALMVCGAGSIPAAQAADGGYTIVPSPSDSRHAMLYAVSGTASDDVWAMGTEIEHFDGAAWSKVASPYLRTPLTSVAAVSRNDAWAAGSYGQDASAILLHWDGASWSNVTIPGTPTRITWGKVLARSADDVWVLGGNDISGDEYPQYVLAAAHWDGTSWTYTENPSGDIYFGVTDAVVLQSGDILASGANYSGSCCVNPGVALFHNGSWSNLHVNKYHSPWYTPAVAAVGGGALVLGQQCNKPSWCQYRWNGQRFRDVWAQQAQQCGLNTLASNGTDVWAAGGCIEKWAGHAFHVYAQLPANDDLFGSTVLPDGTAWFVGATLAPDGTHSRTLTVRVP